MALGVATAIGAPQPDPLLYTNPGLSYLSTQHVPYNHQFYHTVATRDRCLPNTYEDNTGKLKIISKILGKPKKSSDYFWVKFYDFVGIENNINLI